METAIENNGNGRNCLICTIIRLKRTGQQLSLTDAPPVAFGRGSLQHAPENDIMLSAVSS
jgi:hypothetical protein